MTKSTNKLGRTVILIMLIMSIGTACGSKPSSLPTPTETLLPLVITPIPPTVTPVLPTHTVEPPTPTLTPTSTPVPQPNDYLLAVDELPVELFKSYMHIYIEPVGNITYHILFFNAGVGRVTNTITVAAQPYIKLPDTINWDKNSPRIEDPLIEQNATAFQNNSQLTYAFYKGNALVTISSELTLEELVRLGKIIETRLPEMLTNSPIITFPEKIDTAASSKYFNSLALAKPGSGNNEMIPTATFTHEDFFLCLSMEKVNQSFSQPFSLAIYDIQDEVYVQKWISEFGFFNCGFILPFLPPGQYELRISIDDIIVSILPFEIQ